MENKLVMLLGYGASTVASAIEKVQSQLILWSKDWQIKSWKAWSSEDAIYIRLVVKINVSSSKEQYRVFVFKITKAEIKLVQDQNPTIKAEELK